MIKQEQQIRKVLMTADPLGGVWTYAMDLCRAFQIAGIGVELASMGGPLSAHQHNELEQIPGVNLHESHLKLEWMDDPWDDVEVAGKWLLELESETKPDVIHLNGYTHATLKWRAPVLVVAHSCVLSWWQGVLNEPAPASWSYYKQRVAAGLKAADAVVAISNTYASMLNELYGPIGGIQVIYNGREAAGFYETEKQQQLFAMGRIWDEAKNLGVLSQLHNASKMPVYIAGDNIDPNTAEVVHIDNVKLLGKLSQQQVRAYLAASKYYVLPAKYEPFGLSALEAALSGCILILAENPTLKELWQNAALYFKPDDAEAIDAILLNLENNPEQATEMARRAKQRAQFFSLDRMSRSYQHLYQHLVQTQVLSN